MKRKIKKIKVKSEVKKKTKKGFIFTLLALVILTFMVIELGIYFRAYQIRQETTPAKIRAFVLEQFGLQLSEKKLSEVIESFGRNSVFILTNDSIGNPPSNLADLSNDTWTLLWNGTREHGGTSYPLLEQENTLSAWDSNLKNLAEKMGFELVTDYHPSGFEIGQTGPWTIEMNVTFYYKLEDPTTNTKIENTYPVSVELAINDTENPIYFPDPLFTRKLVGERSIIPVQSLDWMDNYTMAKGKGWFYGEIFTGECLNGLNLKSVPFDDLFNEENKNKLLCYKGDDISTLEEYGNIFGGVILFTGFFTNWGSINLKVPFVAMQDNPYDFIEDKGAALIWAKEDDLSNAYVYDIENLRYFAISGKYSNHSSPDAWSFFSRILDNHTSLDEKYGIETIILGKWEGNTNSSIDHSSNYFGSPVGGYKVMGMPGCRSKEVCAMTALDQPIFRIDDEHKGIYNIPDELYCGDPNTKERCE